MELIASYEATGTVSSIDFTSIPSTYTDLVLKLSLRPNAGGTNNITIQFNSSTGTYTVKRLVGDGSSAASDSSGVANYLSAGYGGSSTATANTFGNAEIYIPNYAGSNAKSISSDSVNETDGSGTYMSLRAGLWDGTGAITSIVMNGDGTNSWVQYSSAYLYGIKNS